MKWICILLVVMAIGLFGTFVGNPEKPKEKPNQEIIINFQSKDYKIVPIEKKFSPQGEGVETETPPPHNDRNEKLKNGFKKYASLFYTLYKFMFWVGFTGLAGALGGWLAYHHKNYKDKTKKEATTVTEATPVTKKATKKEIFWLWCKDFSKRHHRLYQNITIGIGGAWGITLLMMIAKKYTFEFTLLEILIIWLFSFIAGFIGDEIVTLTSDVVLKGLGKKVDKVQKEVDDVEKRVNKIADQVQEDKQEVGKTKEKINQTSKEVRDLYENTKVLTCYSSAIHAKTFPNPISIKKSIDELIKCKDMKMDNDLQRKIYLMLGCLYKLSEYNDRFTKAIEYLNEFLSKCNYPDGKYSKSQVKAVIYNLGCYHAMLIKNKTEQPSTDAKKQSLMYLKIALNMDIDFLNNIKKDHDLDNLRNKFEPEYEKLIT